MSGINVEAVGCPNCGAPLSLAPNQTQTICRYCHSTVRIGQAAGRPGPEAAVTGQLGDEEMEQARQLLADGRRDEAVRLYQARSGATEAAAAEAIDGLARQLSASIILRQQLSPFGCLLLALADLALLASGAALLAGRLPPGVVMAVAVINGLLFLFFGRALVNTLRFLGAPKAPAAVVGYAPIGQYETRRGRVHTFRVLLEVRPAQGSPFTAELALPVLEKSLDKLHRGTMVEVKYRPGKPEEVIFQRRIEQGS